MNTSIHVNHVSEGLVKFTGEGVTATAFVNRDFQWELNMVYVTPPFEGGGSVTHVLRQLLGHHKGGPLVAQRPDVRGEALRAAWMHVHSTAEHLAYAAAAVSN